MNGEEILARTLAYLAAAVFAVPIAKKLGLGSVLGYIIAGAIIGPSGLSLIGDPTEVGHVAEFGVVMLMFLIGLEMRPTLVWRMKGAIFGLVRGDQAGLVRGGFLPLPLTQADIGDVTGLTAVHINRTLQRLRREVGVGIGSQVLQISDFARLSEVSRFDPAYLLVEAET